jgi:hypothetical protein
MVVGITRELGRGRSLGCEMEWHIGRGGGLRTFEISGALAENSIEMRV